MVVLAWQPRNHLVNISLGPKGWEFLVQVLLSLLSLESKMGFNNLLSDRSHAILAEVEVA